MDDSPSEHEYFYFLFMKKTIRKVGLYLLVVLFIQSNALLGQNEVELNEVLVSAPKFLSKLSSTGKVVDIIDSVKIHQNFGKNIGELLAQEASIVVNGSRSNPGTNQELYMRGGNTGQVLVMLDGFPLNDPSQITQVFDWNLIDLRSLERIEIIRGGLSSLYGSDAMLGVINLVSLKSTNTKLEGDVNLSGGSFNTFSPNIRLNGNQGKWNWMLKYNRLQSKGISSANIENGEKDSFVQENIRFSIQRDFKKMGYLEFYGVISGNNIELDSGPYLDESDYSSHTDHRSARILWTKDFANIRWQQKYFNNRTARVFLNDSLEILPSAYSNYYRADYIGWSSGYENFIKINKLFGGEGIVGFEYRSQKTEQSDVSIGDGWLYSSPEIDPSLAQQKLFALYGAYEKDWEDFGGIELAIRGNYNSNFGQFITYSLNPYYRINSESKLFLNYYTGFKVPSLYQLFSPYGNLNLVPERSQNFEFGLKQELDLGRLQIVYFNNLSKDGVVFTSLPDFPYGKYENFQSQKIQGVELNFDYQIQKIGIQTNFSYLKGKTRENDLVEERNILYRRPNFKFSLGVNYPILEKLNLNLGYNYLSKRIDAYYNEQTYSVEDIDLGSYGIVDLNLNYKLNSKWNIAVMGRNILNKKYEESYGYSTLPINIQMNIGFKF